jgi:hypothetical protein
MKFDKETVIKHHFWFLLATAMPLALVGILILMTVVSAEISKNRKDLETKLTAAKVAEAKNDKWIKEIQGRLEKSKKREKEVWEKAYNVQKILFTWPDEIQNRYDFEGGLFASEVKADKNAAATDPKAEEQSVIKHFTGDVVSIDEDAIKMQVTDGRNPPKVFRPTRKMKLTKDGKDAGSSFIAFSPGDRVAITYVEGKYFGDPLTEKEQATFGNSEDGYRTQIAEIIEKVQPLTVKNKGVVQLRGWRYGAKQGGQLVLPEGNAPFLRYVAKEWNTTGNISDEAWMAQEDLWIQRELYRLVRQSNDMVSVFDGKAGNANQQSYTCSNPYWKLELKLQDRKVLVKMTNLLSRRQRVDTKFLITFREGNSDATEIGMQSEPLDPNTSYEELKNISGVPPTGIYRVEQQIDWETAAVKRIDQITMGSLAGDCCHGHRTFDQGLKPFRPVEAKAATGGDKLAGGPDMKMPGGNKGGGAKEDTKKTKNGLNAERYSETPTPEVRHVPFGISLIVGQEHIDRVLYAFSKSRLRILMTQVIINRYPHSVRPSGAEQGAQSNPLGGRGGAGGGLGLPGGFGGGLGGGFGQNTTTPATSGGDSQETNVEMVIYGIASLYQRYPPRPPEAATASPVSQP